MHGLLLSCSRPHCLALASGLRLTGGMKFVLWNAALLLFTAVAASSASAVEQCRQIKVKADREACYDRQSRALAEKRQAGAGKASIDPVDRLKIENDRVSKRLQSICRGC